MFSKAAAIPPADTSVLNPSFFKNIVSSFPVSEPSAPNTDDIQPATVEASIKAKIKATRVATNPKKHFTKPFFAPTIALANKAIAQPMSNT